MTDSRTALPMVGPGSDIDFELFLDCVHCGLCTSACPTYLESGTEMDSPRGRIYLMRGVVEGTLALDAHVRRHLDLCLDCRACESACPSGVRYGHLIEPFRLDLQRLSPQAIRPWWLRLLLFHVLTSARRARWALAPARWLQQVGLFDLLRRPSMLRLMPPILQTLATMLPPLLPRGRPLPKVLPPVGPRRARVALFTGCVNDAVFHQVNWATARVLQYHGCEVWTPPQQVCCGALHYHAGLAEPARRLAMHNAATFLRREASLDAIVVNVAGCGALLKDYGHLLPSASGTALATLVQDVHEFLVKLGPVRPPYPLPIQAVYHDACHLCHAQQIRLPPRQLLQQIERLKLLDVPEAEVCCGAAGSYNLTQPEMAERLGQRKARLIAQVRPQAVFTANAGCLLQIRRHLQSIGSTPWVAHPMEALWAAFSGKRPAFSSLPLAD